jgi:hypothetical protein
MSKTDFLPDPPKTEEERFIDSVLGCDEEMDDELATLILAEYEIDETEFVDNLKQVLQADYRNAPQDSTEAKNLREAIRSITDHQKATAPENAEPESFLNDLFGNVAKVFRTPKLAFRNRGELSEGDRKIIEDLKNDLDNEVR